MHNTNKGFKAYPDNIILENHRIEQQNPGMNTKISEAKLCFSFLFTQY